MRAAEERWATAARGGDSASSSSDSGDETGAPPRANQPLPSSRAKAPTLSTVPANFSGFDASGVFHPPGRIPQAHGAVGFDLPASMAASVVAGFPSQMAPGDSGMAVGWQDDEPRLRLKPLPLVRAQHISEGADLNVLCEQLFQGVPRSSLEEPEVIGT